MEKVCAVIGVGPGNGLALVQRFSREGYEVAMLARSQDYLEQLADEIPRAHAYPCDATDIAQAGAVLGRIRQDLGPISVLIYNAGAGTFKSAEESTPEDFEKNWQVNVLGLLNATQATLGQLREHDSASILVTGASAALRGRANTAPFASAKAAQRSLAQSLARQLGPEQIHVGYVIIDGVVDLPRTREMLPDKPDDFFINPDGVAEAIWSLHQQPRSAWTFELDLRPFGESW